MATRLEININAETEHFLQDKLEQGKSPEEVVAVGTHLLHLMENAKEVGLLDSKQD